MKHRHGSYEMVQIIGGNDLLCRMKFFNENVLPMDVHLVLNCFAHHRMGFWCCLFFK